MLFLPEKRTAPEFLDLPPECYTLDELEDSLADIRAVNRYLGDRRALLKHLRTRLAGMQSFSLLDVATGSGDLPIAIASWARAAGKSTEITAVDINERTVDLAREQAEAYPEIRFQVADGLSLPFADKSFDFVICCKTFHHLLDDEAVRLVKEMSRVARRGFIIMDLRRSWIAYFLIYLLTRIFTRNRLTRFDAPMSVLKGFTAKELAGIASKAGGERFTISGEPFWLLVLAGEVR